MSEPFSSQIEEDLMIMLHQAFYSGELLEKPLGSSDDMRFFIGVTSWSHGEEAFTIPDFTFKEARILVYIDGHPHYSRVRSRRDNEINRLLIERGYIVLRFLYRVNTKKLRLGFLQTIIETVNKKIER